MGRAAGDGAAGGQEAQPAVCATDRATLEHADQPALVALEWDWDSAYLIEHYSDVDPEEWVALRRDTGERLSAPTADGLRKLIEDDYRAAPVPRDVAP